jgi:hypothetical protein
MSLFTVEFYHRPYHEDSYTNDEDEGYAEDKGKCPVDPFNHI